MKCLIFDVETNGLPKNNRAPLFKTHLWPHIVQFSWLVYDTKKKKIIDVHNYIVKIPDNVDLPEESVKIHKITRKDTQEQGVNISYILKKFSKDYLSCDLLVAHNYKFDSKIVGVEYIRNGDVGDLFCNIFDMVPKKYYCTMHNSINICKIVRTDKYGEKYYKYPKLIELHEKLFKQTIRNAHNALIDVYACLRCFCKIKFDYDVLTINKSGKFIDYYVDISGMAFY